MLFINLETPQICVKYFFNNRWSIHKYSVDYLINFCRNVGKQINTIIRLQFNFGSYYIWLTNRKQTHAVAAFPMTARLPRISPIRNASALHTQTHTRTLHRLGALDKGGGGEDVYVWRTLDQINVQRYHSERVECQVEFVWVGLRESLCFIKPPTVNSAHTHCIIIMNKQLSVSRLRTAPFLRHLLKLLDESCACVDNDYYCNDYICHMCSWVSIVL